MDSRELPLTVRPPGSRTQTILIIRLKSLGDIVLSTVLVTALRSNWPDVVVDYLVDEPFAGVTTAVPGVRRELVRPRGWAARVGQLAEIQGQYDVVLDLHGAASAAITARFASRGTVVGWAGKRLSRLYSVAVRDVDANRHTAEVNLDFVRALGLPEPGRPVFAAPVDARRTDSYRERFGAGAVLLHPGARFEHKAWPAARFRQLADHLESKGSHPHLLIGPGEEVAAELAHLPVVRDVLPAELWYLLPAFDLYIGNDSGPMHMAAAAGCRVVGIFGPSDPARWRPFGTRSRFVAESCACGFGWQQACRHPEDWCLGRVTVERVIGVLESLAG